MIHWTRVHRSQANGPQSHCQWPIGHHLLGSIGYNPILFPFCIVPYQEFFCFHLSLKYHGNTCLLLKIAELTGVHTQIISQPWDYKDHKYLWNKSCFWIIKKLESFCSFELIWAHLTSFELTETSDIRKYKYLENFLGWYITLWHHYLWRHFVFIISIRLNFRIFR